MILRMLTIVKSDSHRADPILDHLRDGLEVSGVRGVGDQT